MRTYAAIDLKSFYASVECVERGLDPLTTRLVVADERRTEKTICLAVTPALKQYGLSGRSRLFEVVEKAREVEQRTGKPLDYIVAPPRMKLYMDYSVRIYEQVYLAWIAPEDIHVYSVDEVFLDLTAYLGLYGMDAHTLVRQIIRDILRLTGITATGGIGTNLYLAKIAMDIMAKHIDADEDGVRIAFLDEQTYRRELWGHRPLTSFWRIGRGLAARLERMGCFTMGDVARLSLTNEDGLYREFGIDAELLIDHAWGVEPCTIADIKAFRPGTHSISAGQVLAHPYTNAQGRVIVREMADALALELVDKGLVCDGVGLTVIYEPDPAWKGAQQKDWYGRQMPKSAHGTAPLTDSGGAKRMTDSAKSIVDAILRIYDSVTEPTLAVRRFYLALNNTVPTDEAVRADVRQLNFFTDPAAVEAERRDSDRRHRIAEALLHIKGKYGKNAILMGTSYQEGATARERNAQIGGHAAYAEEDQDGDL